MKNFTLLLLLIAAVTITGCKKDKDEDASGGIVGKWYLYSYNYIEYTNGKITDQINQNFTDRGQYIDFKSNGIAVSSDGDQSTYKINGSKLTVKDEDGYEQIFDIKKINNSELVIYSELVEHVGSETTKYTTESTYKK